jgi:hypothetical protein
MIGGCPIALCDLRAMDPPTRMNKRLWNRLASKTGLSKMMTTR